MKHLLAEENLHEGGNSPCCDVWEQEDRSLMLREVKVWRLKGAEVIFFSYLGSDE